MNKREQIPFHLLVAVKWRNEEYVFRSIIILLWNCALDVPQNSYPLYFSIRCFYHFDLVRGRHPFKASNVEEQSILTVFGP